MMVMSWPSLCNGYYGVKKRWQHSVAFYASILLIIAFFLVKVVYLGGFPIMHQTSHDSQVLKFILSFFSKELNF